MAMVPHERSLVQRLHDKPFVLLGVSKDPSRADMKEAQDKHRMPWRSWWDGSRRIARKYEIPGYPTLFLLNPDGIIRRVYVGRPRDADLERDVMQVINEAETAANKAAQRSRTKTGSDS